MRLDAWGDSNIGLVRKNNQDSVGCFPEQALFVVADGMGGRSEGEVASRLAVDTLRESLSGEEPRGERGRSWRRLLGMQPAEPAGASNGALLRTAIELANKRIFDAGQQQTSDETALRGTMGTTVVALLCDLAGRQAYWAHVGDSRLYRVRDGAVALLTADHTVYGEAFWRAPSVPRELPHTNRLVRALGIGPDVDVATGADALAAGDLYCLCSDGVSGMVKPDALAAQLLGGGALEEIGRALIAAALEGGGKDNASVLLVRVHGD
jgi:serine/threonine protein phosphatase PrpC